MTFPSIVKGQYWDVGVFSPSTVTVPTLLCGLNTRNLTHQFQTSSEYIRDCADPKSVPARVVNVTGEQFDIAGNGLFNRAQASLLRTIAGKSVKYRFIMSEDASDPVDAGYYEGNFVASNIQYGGADGTNTTVSLTFESDGPVTWHPTAGETTLNVLDLTPHTATHGTQYSGTIIGATTGSTIIAVSDDSTTLTVTNGTVTGTFTAAGHPTITLTETLAGATNSPKTSAVILTVS